MAEKKKIAFVGVGSIFDMHIQSAEANPNVEVYAFCDIDEAKLRAKGERHGIRRLYTSEEEMLRDLPELDGVMVCTWNQAHAPCTIAALNAGKHVFCEKPMALNAAEAEEMEEAARRNGKQLMIGFVRRFGDDCKAVQAFMEDGSLGTPYFAKAKYIRRNGFPGGWFGQKKLSGGGPLIDLGVHVIDLIRYVAGNPQPVSVYAMTSDRLGMMKDVLRGSDAYLSQSAMQSESDVEDFAAAMIRFDNGMVLSVETSFTLNGEDSAEVSIYGDKGGMRIEPEMELFTVRNGYCVNILPQPAAKFDFARSFAAELDYFVRAMDHPEQDAFAQDGVVLMKILTAAYESARTGHEVVLK